MTNEEYINRPMTGDRVIRSLFSLFCENYDDLELRENYEAAMNWYEELWEKQQIKRTTTMATGTVETVAGRSDHLLRGASIGLHGNVWPQPSAFEKAEIHQHKI